VELAILEFEELGGFLSDFEVGFGLNPFHHDVPTLVKF